MQQAAQNIGQVIESYLTEHIEDDSVDRVTAALLRGEVIHRVLDGRPSIVALRNGILFVGGREYVVADA
jgi:hypothetical protein